MSIFGRSSQSHEDRTGDAAPSPVGEVLSVSSRRIGEIVESAERAVREIRAESAAKLGSHPDGTAVNRERIVAELVESLVARAEELSREANELSSLLERAGSRLGAVDAPAPTPVAAGSPSATPEVGPAAPPPPELSQQVSERFSDTPADGGTKIPFRRRPGVARAAREKRSSHSTEGLRLLATQMAVAGSSRDEIEARLRNEFGIEDASELLGDVRTSA